MYQVEVVILIYDQILITNLQENVRQLEERINNQILGIKGLRRHFDWISWKQPSLIRKGRPKKKILQETD